MGDLAAAGLSESATPLPERLEQVAAQIAAELTASLPELTERWYEQMARNPQLVSWRRPDVRQTVLPHARTDIGRELSGLAAGRRLPGSCPAEVVESARLAAVSGLPLWAALQAYRVGHAQQWRAWSEAVERRRLEPADRVALLQAGSDYFFAYADRCMRWLEIEYMAARERPLRRAEQRRVQLVTRLLEGRDADPQELGYDPSRWNLGVVASSGLEPAVERAAAACGASVLAVAAEASTVWMWIGASSPPTSVWEELADRRPETESALAIGEAHEGLTGFRQTHREAHVAAAVGARLGRAVTRYADVALEDLASGNPKLAAAFVRRELGALDADTREARMLRETLSAYFACAQRSSSAALRLGVHERTVGNRLRRIETLLGRAATGRPVELQVALRLRALREVPAGDESGREDRSLQA